MTRFFTPLSIVLLAMGLNACGPVGGSGNTAPDLGFLPARPQKGSLFRSYSPSGASEWSDNWTSQFDLTGVSWNDPRTATAISRNHVVMAAHFIRPSNRSLVFHDRQGRPHFRAIRKVESLGALGDIALATLDQPLPPGIAHYPLANSADATHERAVLVTDHQMHLSVHRLGRVESRRVVLGNDPEIPKSYWRNLIVGDSGNPAFILKNNRLHLLTTFSSGGSGSGPFYGDPLIQEALGSKL